MSIFAELSILLAITTATATLARIFRQPLIVGYLVSGVLVGPQVLNLLSSNEYIDLFSKIGIAVLLFIVGLNLNPEIIKETGRPAVVTGIGQIIFTSFIGFILMLLLGFPVTASLYGAVALTFSSTIIVLKLLSDKGDLGKLHGKISIGFLLVQDFVAALLLIIIPLVAARETTSGGAPLMFFELFIKGGGSALFLYGISKYILPRLSSFLARSQELLFLFSVTWGLGLASYFAWIGFSIEIGALIAGVTLSVSSYSFEISSRMRPLRDFFLVLFFIFLGSQISLDAVHELIMPALVLSFFVLVGNPFIVFILMNLLGYRSRTAFMAGLTVAQISEFSLILVALGYSLGQVGQDVVALTTLVGIITIAGSTYLILYSEHVYRVIKNVLRLFEFRTPPRRERHARSHEYEMIIFGYGRVGFEFVRTAQMLGISYVVVDYNPSTITHLRGEGVSFRFGDAEDVEFLDEIGLAKARIVVSTIPDPNINILLVRDYRRTNTDGIIVPLSHTVVEARSLYLEGASYVIMPHYLGAQKAASMLQKHFDNVEAFERARNEQLSHMATYEKGEEKDL